MSNSAKSILVYGVYIFFYGIALMVIPNAMLSFVGLPPTQEVWIREVGMLLFLMSFYYILTARHEITLFFQWTVYTRIAAILILSAFVALGFMLPILLLAASADFIGAVWTQLALRHEKKSAISRSV